MERIEKLKYETENTGAKVKNDPYFNGPAEFLVQEIVRQLRSVPQWAKIFSDCIEPYKRMDFSMRQLPALRIYNDIANKEQESWYVEGDIKADIILPAVLRRNELQQVQDTLSMALLQQFRRPTFFTTLMDLVPGLNELGKRFSVDKSLGFEMEEQMVPLTQIVINFRIQLETWDDYLESTDRTKDSPFEAVLGSLDRIVTTIDGLKDDNETTEVQIGIDQKTTGE